MAEKLGDYGILHGLARHFGLPNSSLVDAVQAGRLKTRQLACGTKVLRVSDVVAWSKIPRKRGPKPKATVAKKNKSLPGKALR